jgi:hypothetical protein
MLGVEHLGCCIFFLEFTVLGSLEGGGGKISRLVRNEVSGNR